METLTGNGLRTEFLRGPMGANRTHVLRQRSLCVLAGSQNISLGTTGRAFRLLVSGVASDRLEFSDSWLRLLLPLE